jgi:hypothetical protein
MDSDSGYLPTKFGYQKLRMSTFNYFKESDAFRFMVKAENSISLHQIDVLELGINEPPKAKDYWVTFSGNDRYNNYSMQTII